MAMAFKPVDDFRHYIYIFLVATGLSRCNAKGPLVECPLEWKAAGDGFVPKNSLTCSEGTWEYVAKVFHKPTATWISGRVVPSVGKALFGHEGTVLEYSTYQVLVPPDYCEILWVPTTGNQLPPFAVRVDQGNDKLFVGRGSDRTQSLCGTIDLDESELTIVDPDYQIITRRYFEVVTSTYPEIYAEIGDFEFDLSQLSNSIAKCVLIGAETVRFDTSNLGPTKSATTINHSKLTTERFTLLEPGLQWAGLANISFVFPIFSGESDVSATVVVKEDDVEVMTTRKRHLQVDSVIDIDRLPSTSPPPQQMEVCSLALVVDDVGINFPYTATITYKSERLLDTQILNVLTALGRLPAQIAGPTEGILRGRFILNTALYIDNPDPVLICSKYRIRNCLVVP